MAERPHVLLSAAMSADGYIDDASGHGLELSDAADWDRVDELRAASDAILVGARTIRTDNPRLLVRSAARRAWRAAAGLPESPRKVTMTSGGVLDPTSLFFTAADVPPLVYVPDNAAEEIAARLVRVAEVVRAPSCAASIGAASTGVDLAWLLANLASRGISRLMVEGGATVLAQFLSAGLADELRLAVAPVFIADQRAPRLLDGPRPAGRMQLAGVSQLGDMAVLRYLLGSEVAAEVWPA